MLREGILGQSVGCLNQAADTIGIAVQVKLARTEYGTLNLNHVVVAVQNGLDGDGIAIGHLEVVHFEFVNVVDGIALTGLTHQSDGFLMGIACKSSCIPDEGS